MVHTCPEGYLTIGEAFQQALSILENRDEVASQIEDGKTDEELSEIFIKYDVLERRVERRMRDALADGDLPVFIRNGDHQIERLIDREGWRQQAIIPCIDNVPEPVTNPGVDTNDQPALVKANDFHEWLTRDRHAIDPFRSGAPGKPSAIRRVEQEHLRRLAAGEALEGVGKEAAYLKGWLDWAYPDAPRTTNKTIENRIRAAHRKGRSLIAR